MDALIAANRMAQDFTEHYRRFADHTVDRQERNVRLLRSFYEASMREAQRQAEANFVLAQELFEQSEEQREALGRLTEKVLRAYWGLVFSPAGFLHFGGVVPRRADQEEPAAETGSVAFPIPGYARLTSAQAIEKLDGLSVEELKKLRAYEMEHKNRKGLLARLDLRINAAR